MTDDLKRKTARRYNDEEKSEILQYVRKINAEKGRGGVSAAVRKYNVSPITVNSWLRRDKDGGLGAPLPKNASTVEIYQRLADLFSHIESKRTELARMEKEYDELKRRIQ